MIFIFVILFCLCGLGYSQTNLEYTGQVITNGTMFTSVPPAGSGPTITSVQVLALSSTSAGVSWTTSPSTTNNCVDYGLTTAYGSTVLSNVNTTTPSNYVTGLSEATTYHFRCRSGNASNGLNSTNTDSTFWTLSITPTNLSGATNIAWWVADNITGTNATGYITNWPDSGLGGFNLRKIGSAGVPMVSNNWLNGHAIVHFSTTTNSALVNTAYFANQPQEVMAVISIPVATEPAYTWIIDSTNTSYRNGFETSSAVSGAYRHYAGSASGYYTLPGKWFVLDLVFSGASSGILSNNVSASGTNSIGTQADAGFTFGNRYDLSQSCLFDVAEIVTYSNILGGVGSAGVFSSASARTNLYNYLTNKYAISP